MPESKAEKEIECNPPLKKKGGECRSTETDESFLACMMSRCRI
jgi:hypothetical protein